MTTSDQSRTGIAADLAFVLYVTLITLLPVSGILMAQGADAAYWLLTGDAYLYLGIALSSTPEMFSFDGQEPTNGFHPLWQAYVWAAAQLVGGDRLALMNIAAWSNVLLTWAGVLLIGAAVRRATGSWLLACLVVPGVYFAVIGQAFGNLSIWNTFSGMENGLVLAITGLLLLQIADLGRDGRTAPGWKWWLLVGTTCAALMLARLDEVFVAPAMGLAWLFWRREGWVARIPPVVLLGLPSVAALGLYFAYNLAHVGVAMPVSGSAKGGGALLSNVYVTLVTFFGPVFDLRSGLTDYDGDRNVIAAAGFRVVQLVFPALLALLFAAITRSVHRDRPWAPFVFGICVAICIKAAYNFVAVNYWYQASWYFAVAMGSISFIGALLLAPLLERARSAGPAVLTLAVVLVAAMSMAHASKVYAQRLTAQVPIERQAFVQAGPEIDAALEAVVPDARVLEFGDGMVNFTLDLPVRHGFALAAGIETLGALDQGRLLRNSHDDGYGIVASYDYIRWPGARVGMPSEEVVAFLKSSFLEDRVKAELDRFDWSVVHVYEPLSIPFFAMTPKPAG